MCKLLSGLDQSPFAVQSPKCALQSLFDASVNSCREHVDGGSEAGHEARGLLLATT